MTTRAAPDSVTIAHLLVGTVEPLGTKGTTSGIAKSPVSGRRVISQTGLVDDRQADLENHGGLEKAIHHYPFDHYEAWRKELPGHPLLAHVGAFGENLSSTGLLESDVCIGDTWRAGSAVLQISQGRQPCFKLNLRFGIDDMAYRVQKTLRAGWYYRVIETGAVEQGDQIELVERRHPDWTVERALGLLFLRTGAFDELDSMSQLPELAESWRKLARRRVELRKTEDWSSRLGL
jgi:MOSC domain-containing protein YiiM